jgi:hypothetical protein
MEIKSTVMIQNVPDKRFDPLLDRDATRCGTIPTYENLKYLLGESMCWQRNIQITQDKVMESQAQRSQDCSLQVLNY